MTAPARPAGVTELTVLAAPPKAAAQGCASGSCGTSSAGLSPEIAAKVAQHPCYSADAHREFARMHVPVAPGCNIQCNYCNRKFDCSNESRPGVTSTLLSPEQAVAKVLHVAERIPQLSVVGVAGPGEPLANARRTLGTLEMVARARPDLTLCVSTNGLTLPDHVDRIASLGIGHVTVTVNMTDPEVGARIYPWITFRGKRLTGTEAARVLSERQLEGIAALRDRGILCKVNSVMIPGVNDEHLVEVSRVVRDLGAFSHNVMPLISAPEHGTHFGLTGQRGPTTRELQVLRDTCEADAAAAAGDAVADGMRMSLMRHCNQCRADAIGMLGDDRSAEFAAFGAAEARAGLDAVAAPGCSEIPGTPADTARPAAAPVARAASAGAAPHAPEGAPVDLGGPVVRVAAAVDDEGLVGKHFGHAEQFAVYEVGPGSLTYLETREVGRYCGGPDDCGDAATTLERTVAMLADCAVVLSSRIGAAPRRALAARGVEALEVYDAVERAVRAAAARHLSAPDAGHAALAGPAPTAGAGHAALAVTP